MPGLCRAAPDADTLIETFLHKRMTSTFHSEEMMAVAATGRLFHNSRRCLHCAMPGVCAADEDVIWDCIIVGAGVAGLQCARALSDASPGVKLLVLEAGDRLGGRVRQCEHFIPGTKVSAISLHA